MMTKRIFGLLGALALTAALSLPANATRRLMDGIPWPQAYRCANCHAGPGGAGLNPFGQDIADDFLVDGNVDWGPLLASIDSDGDGYTNGQELVDLDGDYQNDTLDDGRGWEPSNPGDPEDIPLALAPGSILPPDTGPSYGIVGSIVVDDFGGTITFDAGPPVPIADDVEFIDIDLATMEIGQWFFMAGVLNSAGKMVLVRVVARDPLPSSAGLGTLGLEFGGTTVLEDGRQAIIPKGRERPIAFGAKAFRGLDRVEIPITEVMPGDRVEMIETFDAAVLEIHVDPPPFAHNNSSPFYSLVGPIFDIDRRFRTVTFEFTRDIFEVDEDTEYVDEFGLSLDREDLSFGDGLLLQVDRNSNIVLVAELRDDSRDYSDVFNNQDIRAEWVDFLGFDGNRIILREGGAPRQVALDVRIVDEETGEDLTGSIVAEDLIGETVSAKVRRTLRGTHLGVEIIVEFGLNPPDRPLEPGEIESWHKSGPLPSA